MCKICDEVLNRCKFMKQKNEKAIEKIYKNGIHIEHIETFIKEMESEVTAYKDIIYMIENMKAMEKEA